MKQPILLLVAMFAFATVSLAQTSTYILVRHAEKDTAKGTMMSADPALSKAGEQRAINLVAALKDYTIDAVYSTNYNRTKSTVAPIASKFGKEIQVYSPSKAFAEQLLQLKGKTILVAGHSNTIPALANALLKEQKFKDLDDTVYNKIFIVTIDGDKASAKVLEY